MMNRENSILIGLLVIGLGLSGCQQITDNNPQPQTSAKASNASATSLEGLSPQNLLKTKYDQAELDCELNFPITVGQTQSGETTQQTFNGSDSFRWDLLKDYGSSKTLTLAAVTDGYTLTLTFDVTKIDIIANTSVTGDDGSYYELQNSPVVNATYSYQLDKPFDILDDGKPGSVINPTGNGTVELYEDGERQLINEKNTSNLSDGSGSGELDIRLKCQLQTSVKTAYQSEFFKKPAPL